MSKFSELGVSPHLDAILSRLSFVEPTPVQAATIPDSLSGRSICAQAPTGSGKTLAFGLALATAIEKSPPKRPGGLVLVPTRELANQVRAALTPFFPGHKDRVIACYGGTGYGPTNRALAHGVDVIVACPGRLEDLVAQRAVDLSGVKVAVLDECDRLADMGFLPPVKRILDGVRDDAQILLFSATIGPEVESIIRNYLHDPARHTLVSEDSENEGTVEHHFVELNKEARIGHIAQLVKENGQVVVFCRTKRGADRVAKQLGEQGMRSVAIHGDRTQAQREKALATFSAGRAEALVATDVAARGIHIDELPCVVHFDPPSDAMTYVHRSGRTGRAGNDGLVVSFVTPEHRGVIKSLQRDLKKLKSGLQVAQNDLFGREPREPKEKPQRHESHSDVRDERGTENRSERRARHGSPRQHRSNSSPRALDAGSRRSGVERRFARPAGRGAQTKGNIRHPKERRNAMPTGTVKFFNNEKGYGFVSRPDGEDVFVHYSNIEGSGFRSLETGQQVEFEIAQGRKGDEARNVRVL